MKIKFNGFVFALIAAIFVAYLLPTGPEILHLHTVTDIGIGLIFFFYGLKLSFSEIKKGLSNYKLHLLIQLSTFILFPVVILLAKPLLVNLLGELFWVGLFFMAALPSTVSSSVVMVSLAKGNVPAAIFNASISGLIGLAVTPLWIGLIVNEVQGISFMDILPKLLMQIIIPITLGILLNGKLGHIAKKHSKKISTFDKCIIVLIVYSSFSESFTSNLFAGLEWIQFAYLFAAIMILFLVVMFLMNSFSKALGFTTEDRITALFCGSKKSLVHGSVMVKVIFGDSPNGGIYILPVMLYHISQIIIIAIIAERLGKRNIKSAGAVA
ncbi:bile acid:sodium symporter family protein [Flavobacterium rhizosphaerae]|uniref:Bile acid:sodium symporter family protein n=1 Tax=Flavobacterium rhizosphaerae TaxID=3163298 RepID=A0ABW8Z045_9FLAO